MRNGISVYQKWNICILLKELEINYKLTIKGHFQEIDPHSLNSF